MADICATRPGSAGCYDISPVQLVQLFRTLGRDKETLDRLGLRPTLVHFGDWLHVLDGAADVAALGQAWKHVVDSHPLLRSSFRWDDLEHPVQIVHDHATAPLERHDWRHLDGAAAARKLGELLEQYRADPFRPDRAPLARLIVAELAEDRSWLILATHVLLMDASSVASVIDDILACYAAIQAGRPPRVRRRPPYHEHAASFGEWSVDSAEAFWRAELTGFTEPTDLHQDDEGVGPAGLLDKVEERLRIPPQLTTALRSTAARTGLEIETMVIAAWALAVSRYTGRADVVVGVDVDGRSHGSARINRMLGPLRNQLPLRVAVDEHVTALPWLQAVQDRWQRVREHEHVPQAMIREWSEIPRIDDLFWHTIAVERARAWRPPGGLRVRRERIAERPPEALAIRVVDTGAALEAQATYCTGLFEPGLVRQLLGHLSQILDGFATRPDQPLKSLSMLTPAEVDRLIRGWNTTSAAYPKDQCLHWMFGRQAEAAPGATAIVHGAERLSYAGLRRRAGRWARRLRRLGVGTEALVGVRLSRSPELVAALLGVLEAGAAYVPVDPAYPAERLSMLIADTRAAALITDRAVPDGLPCPVIWPEDRAGEREAGEPPGSPVRSGNLAYVLYTSGSTGRPKGVAITHRSAVDMLCWARDTFAADLECVLATTSVCFDCSILEIFGPLCHGGTVVLAESALDIAAAAGDQEVRLVHAVPSVMAELLRTDRLPGSVRTVILGGEAPWPSLVDDVYAASSVQRLFNVYGPTECTSYATALEIIKAQELSSSIGRPVANTAIYLLDRYGSLLPAGIDGELYIGGEGVARGYLGAPGPTADRFVPDPFSGVPGARLYRSGDLARYRLDGELLFLGRADDQVKVRGYRVEPGEVEQALLRHPMVAEAAVVARAGDNADHALTAYVVPRGSPAPAPAELRAHLRSVLPHYLVPDAYLTLHSLPRTPNGKVDRRALTGAEPVDSPPRPYVPPGDGPEAVLADLWAELLGMDRVGATDGFFDIGGDSFLAMRMISRARKAGLDLSPADVFAYQTLAELAAVAADRAASGGPPGGGQRCA